MVVKKVSEKVVLGLGDKVTRGVESFGHYIIFLREIFLTFLKGKIHFSNTLKQMAFIGTDSLPIVLITSFAVGMVFCLQVATVMITYGAVSMVGGVTAMSLVRELAPIFTAVVVAGRVGAAITAEIGSMKVTEQLDALTAMAVPPVYYLILPRTIAAIIMVPLLTLIALAVGIGGGVLIGVSVKGIILSVFMDSVKTMLLISDVFKALFKGAFFGIVVATVACYQGVNTGKGAQGVGQATTASVVISLITIFISNYFLSVILFTAM